MSTGTMSVLQVNSSDVGGGAERVMTDLHEQYLQRGIDSWMAVGRKHSKSPRVLEIPNDEARSAWARMLISEAERLSSPGESAARRAAEYALRAIAEPARYADILGGVEDMHFPATSRLLDLAPTRPDVLHLHNLHGYYFDLRQLPALSSGQPTIVTLHDTWLFTGHCAHPFDCPKWQTGCGGCPDLDIYVPIRTDTSARNWRIKHDLVMKSRVALASPSEWLMRMVQTSGIADNALDARVIPNGVDTSVFAPGDRLRARAMLGLPANRKIVLFSATNSTENPFKDFATLAKALSSVAATESDLLLVALGAEGVAGDIAGVETLRVPFVTDRARIALYYQAADLYVHASRAESFGLDHR